MTSWLLACVSGQHSGKDWHDQHHVIAVTVLCHQHAMPTPCRLCANTPASKYHSHQSVFHSTGATGSTVRTAEEKLCCLLFKLTFAQSETPSNEHYAPKPYLLSILAILNI